MIVDVILLCLSTIVSITYIVIRICLTSEEEIKKLLKEMEDTMRFNNEEYNKIFPRPKVVVKDEDVADPEDQMIDKKETKEEKPEVKEKEKIKKPVKKETPKEEDPEEGDPEEGDPEEGDPEEGDPEEGGE